jgi:hypothetical protein
MEQLREEIEIAPTLAVEEVRSFTALEFKDGIFAFLHGPREKEMTA